MPLTQIHRIATSRAVVAVSLVLATMMVAGTAWSPVTASATRSVTFIIQTPDGRPASGLGLEWWAIDGSASSSDCKVTDSEGKVRWNSVPITRVEIDHCQWHYATIANGPDLTHLVRELDVPVSGPIVVSTGPVPETRRVEVKVRMPDGTPVGDNVTVRPGHGVSEESDLSYHWGGENTGGPGGQRTTAWLACRSADPWCPAVKENLSPAPVDVNGVARIRRFVEPQKIVHGTRSGYCYKAIYDDGDLRQTATAGCTSLDSVTVKLPYMPVVEVAQPPLTAALAGDSVSIPVRAVDGVGEPISGQTVTAAAVTGGSLASIASVAPATSCSPKLRGQTGSAGRTTLRICADKTRKWRADGLSIVASRPFQVLVRKKGSPGRPRDLKVTRPSANKLVFSWRAPTHKGWSKIKNYQIRWSTNGGYSWTSWKPTGLDRRHGPVSLQSGKRYIYQIRAVNGRGGGQVRKHWAAGR